MGHKLMSLWDATTCRWRIGHCAGLPYSFSKCSSGTSCMIITWETCSQASQRFDKILKNVCLREWKGNTTENFDQLVHSPSARDILGWARWSCGAQNSPGFHVCARQTHWSCHLLPHKAEIKEAEVKPWHWDTECGLPDMGLNCKSRRLSQVSSKCYILRSATG